MKASKDIIPHMFIKNIVNVKRKICLLTICIPLTSKDRKRLPKFKNPNCDADITDNLNSKDDIENGSSGHTNEEINILSYFIPTRK